MSTPPTPPAPQRPSGGRDPQTIVLWSLGLITIIGLIGYILLGALHTTVNTEPLTTVIAACVGSLGTFLATEGLRQNQAPPPDPQEEYELLIGRAATRSMIAEAMRQMGVQNPPLPPSPPSGGNP